MILTDLYFHQLEESQRPTADVIDINSARPKDEPVFNVTKNAIKLSAVAQVFENAYSQITRTLPYTAAWENGTGYFDHAVQGVHSVSVHYADSQELHPARHYLKPGETARSMDESGRRMIFIGTRLGMLVVFERYPDDRERYTFNASAELSQSGLLRAFFDHRPSAAALEFVVGSEIDCNLGERLERIYHDMCANSVAALIN